MSGDESQERTDAVRALEAEFGELIHRMRRLLSDNAQRLSPGMQPGTYKVFGAIARRESIAQSALAELLLVDKGQLSRAARELEQLGLIDRSPDPDDGRASILSVTPFGRERLAAVRAPQEDTLAHALAKWRIEHIHDLTRLLHALTTGTEPTI